LNLFLLNTNFLLLLHCYNGTIIARYVIDIWNFVRRVYEISILFFNQLLCTFHQWPDRMIIFLQKNLLWVQNEMGTAYTACRAPQSDTKLQTILIRRLHNSRSNRVFLLRVRRSRLLSKLNRIPEFWHAASINTGVNQTYRDFLSCFLWKSLKTCDIMIETASVDNRRSRSQVYRNIFYFILYLI